MNRENIIIHFTLAVVVVIFAAVLGQIDRWRTALDSAPVMPVSVTVDKENSCSLSRVPEVLVQFRPGVTLDHITALAASNNDRVFDKIESVRGLAVIDDLDNDDPEAVARFYSEMEQIVEWAEPNFKIELSDPSAIRRRGAGSDVPADGPNDPQFTEQWALSNLGQEGGKPDADIRALDAWRVTTGSDEVVVAVLDTGVDFTHADLRENMWFRPADLSPYNDAQRGFIDDVDGFDGTSSLPDPMDDNGHGTHCAGIIGAVGDNSEGIAGVNWRVKIMPLKFLGRWGSGNASDAIAAINYAIERKNSGVNIRVISASWGSTRRSKALEATIRAAGEAGILFVAAAGNDGSDNDRRPHYPSNYDLPNVISVAALDRNDSLASFSNYGVKTVHIAAPGKDILSTWIGNDYREASGTSMATPFVSGVAALIIANEPNITMSQLRERLLDSVDKIETLDGKVSSGGRLNAANAIR
jgi:subtilisin family serine protease